MENTNWTCKSCGYEWEEENPFLTFEKCPKCESEKIKEEK